MIQAVGLVEKNPDSVRRETDARALSSWQRDRGYGIENTECQLFPADPGVRLSLPDRIQLIPMNTGMNLLSQSGKSGCDKADIRLRRRDRLLCVVKLQGKTPGTVCLA